MGYVLPETVIIKNDQSGIPEFCGVRVTYERKHSFWVKIGERPARKACFVGMDGIPSAPYDITFFIITQ